MSIIVYLVAALSGIYGLCWFVFVFTEPRGTMSTYFRHPQLFWFLPEKLARLLMAAIFLGVIPGFATVIVSFFNRM